LAKLTLAWTISAETQFGMMWRASTQRSRCPSARGLDIFLWPLGQDDAAPATPGV
jgi:hypothetical protein